MQVWYCFMRDDEILSIERIELDHHLRPAVDDVDQFEVELELS